VGRRIVPAGLNLIFVEGESECTGEKGAGQFSIFGATEENLCHGSARIFTDLKICEGFARRRLEGCDLKGCEYLREKLARGGWRVVHRACTGNAEMQSPVVSCRLPVSVCWVFRSGEWKNFHGVLGRGILRSSKVS
jgi:hypothetical protein